MARTLYPNAATHSKTPHRPQPPRRRGFSLTELLVVIGIIALLVGILLVALGKVQSKAKRTQTEATMRQFLNACTAFQAENDRLPGVIPEVVLANNPQITSTQNALLDLQGGYRVLGPTDLAGGSADTDYQNYKAQATTTSSMLEFTWPVAGGGSWRLVIDTRKIGEGPVVNGKPHAPYFTPGPGDLAKASYPNAVSPPTDIPSLVDAWGQPILYVRQLRDRGPLVAAANNTPAPQFLRGGNLPYIASSALGELAKDQTALSILMTASDQNATLGRMLEHPSVANQAKGSLCLISAGPDGVFFSRIDGPGSEAVPVNDITIPPLPANSPNANPKVIDQFDDVRMFGGA